MAIIIKNIDSVDHTYCGQVISASGSYNIQATELLKWSNSDDLLSDIAAGLAQVNDGTFDISGIANQINYLKGLDTSPRDPDGSILSRVKAASSGWTAQLHGVEIEVGKLDSVIKTTALTVNTALKFYDANNVELLTQETIDASAVKTTFDWEPTVSYEIIGGEIRIADAVTNDIRVDVIAVPDVPANYGGSKRMATNINLRYYAVSPIKTDGRASKRLTYDVILHTNKLRFIFEHPAGEKLKLAIILELYVS